MPKCDIVTIDSSMGQYAPYSDVPPSYTSARDGASASTSSAVVVATPSGDMLPIEAPPSSVPTSGVNVVTLLDIKGL